MKTIRVCLVNCILMICVTSVAFCASQASTGISTSDLLADTIASGIMSSVNNHGAVAEVVAMPEPSAGLLLLIDLTAVGALVLWFKRRARIA